MTRTEALSYASGTVLGGQIAQAQGLYSQAVSIGAPESFTGPLLSLVENLANLDQRLIAYDRDVATYQQKCTAIARTGVGGIPGQGGGVSPTVATVIGLGSVGVGGILGFAAAKAWSKPKDEDGEEEAP